MALEERTILNHYNLTTAYPTEWPAEKDESDLSDSDVTPLQRRLSARKSTARYSALARAKADTRSSVPGSQKTGDGRDNLVQKDEPDPLGRTESVVKALQQRGLPVEDDVRLRNRFLLSSTTFSPQLYLSQVHSKASAQSLLQGLDYLSRSIDQKSASLKVLVESNFERFVKAKATIDNVYTEMRNSRSTPEQAPNKTSGHFRNVSGGRLSPTPPKDGRKNALTKESEYGVQGIKVPLTEISIKAEEVWGPALGGKEREQTLRSVVVLMEQHGGIYEVGSKVADSIKRRDHESLVEEYTRARRYAEDGRLLVNGNSSSDQSLTDAQIHRIVVTGRMWADVEGQVNDYKRDVWRRITTISPTVHSSNNGAQTEEYLELIGILLELGVEENPIEVWLQSRFDYLKFRIATTSERSKVEIEILRRRLAHGKRPTAQVVASHLRMSSQESKTTSEKQDTPETLELWQFVLSFLKNLLAVQGGTLGELIEYWDTAQSFIDGQKQKTLPTGFEGQSRHHHHLSSEKVADLQKGASELALLIRDSVYSLFADPPIEDVSMLFSPLPPVTPTTPASATLLSQESRLRFDPSNVPPPSPRRGEPWEEFAFWPPYSNSLSGAHYLSKALGLVGNAASEIISLRPVTSDSSTFEKLKSLVGVVRERSVRAVCAAWNQDAEACKALEDWTRATGRRDVTRMPSHFVAFEGAVLSGMQKILYISEVDTKSGVAEVVTPPPTKLLSTARSQFVTTLYKALAGMVENAEKYVQPDGDGWSVGTTDVSSTQAGLAIDFVDASSRVRGVLIFGYRFADNDIERPNAPNAEQFESSSNGICTPINQPVRDEFFRQVDR